jgi:hypothetical protein
MPPVMSEEFHGPSSSLLVHVHKPGGKCPTRNEAQNAIKKLTSSNNEQN